VGERARAPRRTAPFDPRWFASLCGGDGAAVLAAPPLPAAPALPPRRYDWGEAPVAPVVQGRAAELATLTRWVREGRCRVAQVLGAGGIGKTTLADRVAHDLAPEFAVVYWRSLRNAPPVEEWLAGAIAALSAEQAAVPEGIDARLGLLLELLRARRALLTLDNLETVLAPGALEVRYRAGYEGYGTALQRLAEGAHAGCLLLTSREQPLQADDAAVRALHLEGLSVDASQALLGSRALAGDEVAWRVLVARYGGNPLALRVVGETIGAVFGGDIAAFLAQETAVFGGIRQLLDEQVTRLSAPEQTILTALAVAREPVGFAALVADLGPGAPRGEAVEAVEALRRRSLLEWGAGGTFTVQPVVLEYVTTRLVEAVAPPATRPPTNLPPARTSFVGRAADLVALTQALDPVTGSGARLLTLSGVAGCGKTRLALAVADNVRDAYAEGVWLVELAPLPATASTDLTAVAAATLSALGLHEQPGQDLPDTLVAYLQARRLLLILDNCEHVVTSCAALVALLLDACPELRVLTTSQQALGIVDETAWPVGALATLPPVDGAATLEMLRLAGQSEAVRLFVERARARRTWCATGI